MEFNLELSKIFTPQVIAALIASAVAIWGIRSQRQLSRQKNALDFEAAYKRNKEINEANTLVIRFIGRIRKMDPHNQRNAETFRACIVKSLIDPIPDSASDIEKESIQKTRDAVTTVLNEWERAANAVFSNLYDENYLYRAHAISIIQLYYFLEPFIQERQSVVPRYYINFTRLAKRWTARRCMEDDNQQLTKSLTKTLSQYRNQGIRFKEHKVVETETGAAQKLWEADHQIWLIIHNPSWFKRMLKKFKFIAH